MREKPSGNEDDTHAGLAAECIRLVLAYQEDYATLQQTYVPRVREQLEARLQLRLEQIYRILHEPLRRQARKWRGSRSYKEILDSIAADESHTRALDRFAMHLFLHVLEQLHRVQIDPERNVIGLCVKIARQGMAREEQRIYKAYQPTNDPDEPEQPLLRIHRDPNGATERELDITDEQSEEDFMRLLAHLSRDVERQLITDAVEAIASKIDRQIITDRLLTEPAVPYEAIAAQLGDGWSIDAIRKRYERARKQLQRILQHYADEIS